jgi:Putative adhesin
MSRTSIHALEHPIGHEGLFVLQLRSGNVRLHGGDGDTVRIVDEHDTDLEDLFDIERGEGSLAVRARKGLQIQVGSDRRGHSPELDVRLPRRATIVVEAASADLSGEDLAGEQRFHTASGDISLERLSGTVAIEAVSGDVALTATGELRLRARTVSGDLAVRAGALAEVSAATTSGDVAIAGELAPNGTHRVETVSGDTLLALAGGARIEVTTVTGDVRADVPHRSERERDRRVIVIGDGRATLVVRSMSGDVHIAKARARDVPVDAAAIAPPRAPTPPAPPAPASPSDAAIAAAYDEARLGILRSLERGEIDITEAGRRLEALDAAGVPEDDSRG